MTEKDRRLKLQREALAKIKRMSEVYPQHGIVKEELPRVSKGTLNALVSKKILNIETGIFECDGPIYYYWTGKELE